MTAVRSRTQGGNGVRRVFAATDLSSRADRALRRAALLSQATGAELLVLHAIDDDQPRSLVEAGRREAAALVRDQVAGLPELRGGAALADFVAELRLPAPPDQRIALGRPAAVVKDVAARPRPDLLVVGTARTGFLRRAVIGSTAAEVLGAVHCDALAVPPG